MRVTRAGSCETILCSWVAVLLGFSTVRMISLVTSGSVAIVVIFLTVSITFAWGSAGEAAAAGTTGFTVGVATAAGIAGPPEARESSVEEYRFNTRSASAV